MTNLPTSNNVSHSLSDRAGTPLVSSNSHAQSPAQAQSLSSLTTAAITAYDTASRLGLGLPQRMLIETSSSGSVVLHSYLNAQPSQPSRAPTSSREILEQAREDLRPLSGTTESSSTAENASGQVMVNGLDYGKVEEQVEGAEGAEEDEEGPARQTPPMLVGTVVAATAVEVGEARRTAARLERMGREFQREWARESEAANEAVNAIESSEGD